MLLAAAAPGAGQARVVGECGNCHTTHNSQGAVPLWDQIPLRGGPGEFLTKVKCLACHAANDSSTTGQLGQNVVPIVYNSVQPAALTAGGNFFYVESRGDAFGHNVVAEDATLASAPGAGAVACGFGGCHTSLASVRLGPEQAPVQGNGCIACHVARHHAPDPAPGQPTTQENGYYRFLGSPTWGANGAYHVERPGVAGIEDGDWELTVSPSDHNEYLDTDRPGAAPGGDYGVPMGISDFCAGCHQSYHSWSLLDPNRTATGRWLRHPAGDHALPATGEYALYTAYNPQVPVARSTLGTVSAIVTPGVDRVMCLSCHRAHGSPYRKMLRWDYAHMAPGTGCFVCHTSKN